MYEQSIIQLAKYVYIHASCLVQLFLKKKNRKWCMYICVCVYNIGKKVLKLQFSENKYIGLTFIVGMLGNFLFN